MSVFISYSSVDAVPVHELERSLERFGKKVWRDDEILGGEAWWSAILEQIRGCRVFVFAISPNSLDSDPCALEFDYARALGLPILPVEIADIGTEVRRNHPVFQEQSVDYRTPSADSAIALMRAIAERESSRGPLPDPLPPEPPIPYEYLLRLSADIRDRNPIPYDDQRKIVSQFRDALLRERNPSVRASARKLLVELRDRPETSRSIVDEIDRLLEEQVEDVDQREAQRRREQERLAREEQERLEQERLAQERLAQEQLAQEQLAQREQEQLAQREQEERDRLAREERERQQTRAVPGWYRDPRDAAVERYWNGTEWTTQTRPIGGVAPVPQPPAPQPAPSPAPQPAQSNLWSILAIVAGVVTLIPIIHIISWMGAIAFAVVAIVQKEPLRIVGVSVAIAGMVIGLIIAFATGL